MSRFTESAHEPVLVPRQAAPKLPKWRYAMSPHDPAKSQLESTFWGGIFRDKGKFTIENSGVRYGERLILFPDIEGIETGHGRVWSTVKPCKKLRF